MVDDFIYHFSEVSHFVNRCLKFKHETEAFMTPYREVYKDMQKKEKQ